MSVIKLKIRLRHTFFMKFYKNFAIRDYYKYIMLYKGQEYYEDMFQINFLSLQLFDCELEFSRKILEILSYLT